MEAITIPRPTSAGLFLTYRCTNTCKHCMYACSPQWPADWLSEQDAGRILSHLAAGIRTRFPEPGWVQGSGRIGVNDGLHFTGGEPFLNFDLLLRLTRMARELGIPSTFVETNGFWCRDDATALDRLRALRDAGLDGLFVSANPFLLEQIPFERTRRAVRISHEVFPRNTIVYQPFFYQQFEKMGLTGTLRFDEYLERAGYGLQYVELFANGRVPYALGHLFRRHPARHFFGTSCRGELLRDWHIHIDNQGHYLPGFCGGLSLG
ncbi:MAG: radical SAM protein, partial [Anaerolineae bacterium]